MIDFKIIKKSLNNLNIRFEEITFTDEVISARTGDTSVGKNYNPNNAIKTLIIKAKDNFVAVVLKGDQKIDETKLENILGKWSVVNSEILLNKFGFVPGTVCPLVLDIPLFADEEILRMPVLSMGAGDIKKGINVKLDEIRKHLKLKIINVAKKNIDIKQKIHLITRNCQEVLTDEDLKQLIESDKPINHYIGFEISGLVHLGTGYLSMGKVADFIKAGATCRVFLADFHTFLNNKLGGVWDDIRWASENYFKQALIASLSCFDVSEDQVEFISGDDLYKSRPDHWQNFMEVGKQITLSRNLRSISIMGKKQGTDVDMATLFYPPLQVADIVTMDINLAHAGMDQRKAHVIARQAIKKIKGDHLAPVAIHHNLIAGLTGPETSNSDSESLKMSKSKPNSAIFVHDSPDEIRQKLKKAYGPPAVVEFNPLLNWVETMVFWGEETLGAGFEIKRPDRFGGNISYNKFSDVVNDYKSGLLFPLDLKNGLADFFIEKLEPVRKFFEGKEHKQALEKMKSLVTK